MRERPEGVSGLRFGEDVERSERSRGDLESSFPGVFKRSVFFEEGSEDSSADRGGVIEELSRLIGDRGGSGFEQVDDGECELLFFEIGSEAFAGGSFLAQDIEDVVGDLECDAELASISFHRVDDMSRRARVMRPEPTRNRGQFGGLAANDRKIRLFVELDVAPVVNLLHLSFTHAIGGSTDPTTSECGIERRGEVERVSEKEITHQHRGFVPPFGVDRRGVASHHRFVKDIVMNKRGGVDHFNNRGEHGMIMIEAVACEPGEEHERGTQTLAAVLTTVFDEAADERQVACELEIEDPLGLGEPRGDRSEQRRDPRIGLASHLWSHHPIPIEPVRLHTVQFRAVRVQSTPRSSITPDRSRGRRSLAASKRPSVPLVFPRDERNQLSYFYQPTYTYRRSLMR